MSVLTGLTSEVVGGSTGFGLLASKKGSVDLVHAGTITYLGTYGNKKGPPKQPHGPQFT